MYWPVVDVIIVVFYIPDLVLNVPPDIVMCCPFRPVLHADIVISHKEPVTCCMYNPSFKQVVTCSESSVSNL